MPVKRIEMSHTFLVHKSLAGSWSSSAQPERQGQFQADDTQCSRNLGLRCMQSRVVQKHEKGKKGKEKSLHGKGDVPYGLSR